MKRPANPWVAVFLNLFSGASGQIYAGRPGRSATLFILGNLLSCLVLATMAFVRMSPPLFAFFIAILIGYQLFLLVDAYFISRRSSVSPRRWYQRLWFCFAILPVFMALNTLCAILLKSFVAESFAVPGRAMYPTIQHMDRILVDKLWARSESTKRGDVIVYRAPFRYRVPSNAMSDAPDLYIMRVVGLPGETIELKDNTILINGNTFEDPHAFYEGTSPQAAAKYLGPITVPADAFYVLGDNRNLANDSRYTGPVHFGDFHGKAKLILYSRDYSFPTAAELNPPEIGDLRWDRIGTPVE